MVTKLDSFWGAIVKGVLQLSRSGLEVDNKHASTLVTSKNSVIRKEK